MVGGILSDDRPERTVPDGEPALELAGADPDRKVPRRQCAGQAW